MFISGVYVEGVTPLPIPNREVKPLGADGTIWVTVWESRSLPGVILNPISIQFGMGFFLVLYLQMSVPIYMIKY